MEDNLIKKMMASIKCGVCGQQYELDNIDVLGHEEDMWFLSAFCPACHTRCLVAAVVKEGKAHRVITDLTDAELDRFRNVGIPTADELLNMHNFLKDFKGGFAQLFGQR